MPVKPVTEIMTTTTTTTTKITIINH